MGGGNRSRMSSALGAAVTIHGTKRAASSATRAPELMPELHHCSSDSTGTHQGQALVLLVAQMLAEMGEQRVDDVDEPFVGLATKHGVDLLEQWVDLCVLVLQ